MKRMLTLAVMAALIIVATGCRKNPKAIIELPTGPEFAGEYLDTADVRRIGYALNTAADRQTVQWENPVSKYQFSMMVFSSNSAVGTTTRKFTVLTIDPASTAEVLNLIGTSSKRNTWNIVAEAPAVVVGKAVRMQLVATPTPEADLSSEGGFNGFIVVE